MLAFMFDENNMARQLARARAPSAVLP
jgi:hypothetical protein